MASSLSVSPLRDLGNFFAMSPANAITAFITFGCSVCIVLMMDSRKSKMPSRNGLICSKDPVSAMEYNKVVY